MICLEKMGGSIFYETHKSGSKIRKALRQDLEIHLSYRIKNLVIMVNLPLSWSFLGQGLAWI